MLGIQTPTKGSTMRGFISFCCTLLPAVCFSQVLNGSFEVDGQPSLDHWVIGCEDGESFQDAPAGGGGWCLRLPEGNLQGCYPETAEQTSPEFNTGDIWQVSVWARQYEEKTTPTSLYLKIIHSGGAPTVLSADTTTSKDWTRLTVVDTLSLQEGDSVAIVLDAGITSGPQIVDSYSYFDLVEAQRIGEPTSVGGRDDRLPGDFKLFQNSPNPFNPTTRIPFSLPGESDITLRVFDLIGREVAVLATGRWSAGRHQISFDARDLPSGMYLYQLTAGRFKDTRKMVVMK